jgi:hypothetical protein
MCHPPSTHSYGKDRLAEGDFCQMQRRALGGMLGINNKAVLAATIGLMVTC